MPKRQKRTTRVWTDAEKAAAIAYLASCGGNLKRAAREWRADDGSKVSESSLRGWRDNLTEAPPVELVEAKKADLKHLWLALTVPLLRGLGREQAIQRLLSRPAQGATVAAIGTDKIQLLEGQPTEIVEQVSYVEPGTLRALSLRVLEGGRLREESPPPALPARTATGGR